MGDAATPQPSFVRFTASKNIVVNGTAVALPKNKTRYFNLYCYVAIVRREQPSRASVTLAEISRLKGWETAELASIGKKVDVEIKRMRKQGLDLIEPEGEPTQGPYRFALAPAQFEFEVADLDTLRAELLWPERESYIPAGAVQRFFRFVGLVSDSIAAAQSGDGDAEVALLQSALDSAVFPQQRALVLLYMARPAVRDGNTAEVSRLHALVRGELPFCGDYRRWADARLHEQWAAAIYSRSTQQGRQLTSRELKDLSRQIEMGLHATGNDIHSVVTADLLQLLATVRTDRGRYRNALRLLQRALDSAVFGYNMYAVQEIYFSIAEIYSDWADRQHRRAKEAAERSGKPVNVKAATELYTQALTWADEAVSIQQRFGYDKESGKAELLRSQLLLRLDELRQGVEHAVERAIAAATKAYATAERNRDLQIQVFASEALARAHLQGGQLFEAYSVLKRCADAVPPEKFALMRADVREFFNSQRQHYT